MTTLECAIQDAETPETQEVLKALMEDQSLFTNLLDEEHEEVHNG